MKTRRLVLAVLGSGIFCTMAAAADWAQWRGPKRDGISQETGLLQEWPKDGPKARCGRKQNRLARSQRRRRLEKFAEKIN